jgi:hypothetical protein
LLPTPFRKRSSRSLSTSKSINRQPSFVDKKGARNGAFFVFLCFYPERLQSAELRACAKNRVFALLSSRGEKSVFRALGN